MTVATTPKSDRSTLSPREFARVAAIARAEAGLCLSDAKRMLIMSRIAKRLRVTEFDSLGEYLDHLESRNGRHERRHLIGTLTTNVSHFFRERHHYDLLSREVLPPLLNRARSGERIRIWSAGCATGQEPYSIAMTVLKLDRHADELDLRILATDVNDTALAHAEAGQFQADQVQGVDPIDLRGFFRHQMTAGGWGYTANDSLRRIVRFRRLNLLSNWPMRGRFDVVFCRNVVIYFDVETRSDLWVKLEKILAPGGYLFLGHSERLDSSAARRFACVGVTTYRKPLLGKRPGATIRETN